MDTLPVEGVAPSQVGLREDASELDVLKVVNGHKAAGRVDLDHAVHVALEAGLGVEVAEGAAGLEDEPGLAEAPTSSLSLLMISPVSGWR